MRSLLESYLEAGLITCFPRRYDKTSIGNFLRGLDTFKTELVVEGLCAKLANPNLIQVGNDRVALTSQRGDALILQPTDLKISTYTKSGRDIWFALITDQGETCTTQP